MTDNNIINDAFDNGINENNRDEVNSTVREIISDLDLGIVRVASCVDGKWEINEQAKKAILLSLDLIKINVLKRTILNFTIKLTLNLYTPPKIT